MTNKVADHLAKRYEAVRKGVETAMGGHVLDYEAKAILNKGRTEGRTEGMLMTLISLVKDGILTTKDASKRANMTEKEFAALLTASF